MQSNSQLAPAVGAGYNDYRNDLNSRVSAHEHDRNFM